MKPSEALRAAKAKIATPETWTKGCMARNAENKLLERANDSAAQKWCAEGALYAASPEAFLGEANLYLKRSLHEKFLSYQGEVYDFNDSLTTTHADVMALFDRAIALAEKEGR